MTDLSEKLQKYLQSWHKTSTERKVASGVEVTLSFEQFVSLFEKRQLNSLQRALDEHRLQGQQDRTSEYAYVLTWKSYAACSTNVFSVDTACICSRQKSAVINKAKAGDVLRPGHRASIAKGLTGVPKSEDHRKAISKGAKGTKKQPWTEERKAARRALLAAKK